MNKIMQKCYERHHVADTGAMKIDITVNDNWQKQISWASVIQLVNK